MAILTGTSQVAVNIQGYYDRNLLERALPSLVHGKYCQARPLPANSGTRINFRRYNSLAVNTTKLQEGVTPTGKQASTTDIYATLSQYGDFIVYTDWLSMTTLDNSLVEFSGILGEQMGLTSDTLDRDVMVAGTSVRYANDVATRTSVATAISATDMKAAIRILEGGNAKKISEAIQAGAKIATVSVPTAYRAITHTNMRQDFEDMAGFTKAQDYASQKGVQPDEIGAYGNVRIETTTNAKIWEAGGVVVASGPGLVTSDDTNIDVYATVILGANAVGTTPLQKGNIKNIVKKIGASGVDDALDQRGSSGWKMAKVTKRLNEDFMVRIESGCTDL
jgi:N4-gp56 family major capsid protein